MLQKFAYLSTYVESKKAQKESILSTILHVVIGSAFLALVSQAALYLPNTPVPVSMQTFGVLMLVLVQGKTKSIASILLYLAQATVSLPVLAGGEVNPLWFIAPRAGYLFGFLACAWVAGSLLERRTSPSFLWVVFSLTCGHIITLLMGMSWLSVFVGWNHAFFAGVVPFIPGTILKTLAAACASKPLSWSTKK